MTPFKIFIVTLVWVFVVEVLTTLLSCVVIRYAIQTWFEQENEWADKMALKHSVIQTEEKMYQA